MKKCFKCKVQKPLSDFYKHKQMADGHLNKCKTCAKSDVLSHRSENLDKIRAYDRERSNLPHRVVKRAEVFKQYKKDNPERVKANIAVRNAVRDGRIFKWPVCCMPDCDSQRPVAHHADYSRPLDVVWLCQAHHKQAHALVDQPT